MRSRTKKLEASRQVTLLAYLDGPSTFNLESTVEALLASMGATGIGVATTFRLMDVTEQAIAARWPKLPRKETSFAFNYAIALPTLPVRVSDMLYRAHLDELYGRMPETPVAPTTEQGWLMLTRLTRAEVVGLLCETSLRHPLGSYDAFLYEYTFRQLFPGADIANDPCDPFPTVGPRVEQAKRDLAEWLVKESPERLPAIRQLRAETSGKARPRVQRPATARRS